LGKYTIRNVAPNAPLTLRFVDTDRALGVNMQVIFNAGETLTRDVTLRSASLHGRVTQPDGVTGTIAQLSIVVPVPLQQEGMLFGLLDSSNPFSTQSAPNGSYSISGLNPGVYRVSTSNAFFPTTVSKGGTLVPNTDQQCDLSLVSTLAGKIQGRVFQPDGTTPAGAGVEVTIGGGSLADATVRTDENGHYEFAEVFSAGGYTLTAVDPANGNTNRVSISIQRNQDAIADIQLHGNGSLRVHVVDGAGNPVSNGSVNLDGTSYPNAHRYVQLTPDQGGTVLFAGLPEGQYGISAAQGALGGRTSATIPNGSTVDVVIQLQATGSIKGTVFMPDGTTPIGLADVQLTVNGRTVGYTVTSDADDAAGSFSFLYVPTGEFTLDVFDNRTGRVGRSTGRVIIQGQSVITNVKLLPIGAVAGQVMANGSAVDHALVKINADGSGLRGTYLQATTDAEGRYRFTGIPVGRFHVDVSDAPGGQTGSVVGSVTGTVEPLPDTIADIVLEPSATLTGTVYDLGGTTPLPGASVTVYVGGRAFNTSTNSNGIYRIGFVPLGEIRVRAEAPTGYSRGEAALVTVTQPGSTVTSDVVLTGTGSVSGTALDNNGANLTTGTVTFTNDAWGTPLQIIAPVQSNGRFVINGAPAGNFTLQLTVPNRTGTGSASALVSANQNVEVPIRLEDAGAVTGTLKMPDGASPAVGSDVMLSLTKTNGQAYNFYTHTNTQGVWRFDNLPLGTLSVSITDANTGGIARRYGLALTTNGQVLDLGVMLLDTVPISIASVSPADGATNISTTAPQIGVTFSEPADSNTVNTSSLQLLAGNSNVSTSVTLSADKLSATITPAGRLAQQTVYTIVVNGLQDLEGLPLLNQFQSRFTTADETAPGVAAILPAGGATEVSLETKIDITFDEPLDRSQSLTDVIVLSDNTAPGTPLAGTFERDATGRIVTFRPGAALTDSSRYTVTVNGQRDPSGNVQTQTYTSVFTTHDSTAPVVDPLPVDGTSVRNYKPTITATYHDNVSGINTASVVLTLDNTNVTTHATVTGNQVTYTPPASLSGGSHSVSVRVADNGGNLSAVRTATFTIDNSGPMISSFTIGGVPATDGLVVTSSLQPAFSVSYTDDTGINTAATSLLLGQSGSSLVPVPATVTASGLSYQPPSNLTEGQYAVKAVITNNLGTSSTTGVINFTLNVNAPDIATVTPNTGSQHGGMVATITGNRLLSTTGSAPAVSVGGNPAQVLSAMAGSPDQLTIMIPAGAAGAANVQAITDRGTGVRSGGFTYEADPRTPYTTEPDTVLLWHMDETDNSTVQIKDSGATKALYGISSYASTATAGRFAGGRALTNIQAVSDFGSLYFGSNSFTTECWVKTNPVAMTYTLVGKEDFYGGYYGPPEYAIRLTPNGTLRAMVYDSSQRQWKAELAQTNFNVTDNQWHQLAMVVDRTNSQLYLYVDGVERVSSQMPAGFGALYNSGQPFRVGHYSPYDEQTTGGGAEFPGIMDEVRISSTAHSSSAIQRSYLGTEGTLGVSITNPTPISITRGTTNEVQLNGYNLAGATASINSSSGDALTAKVVGSSATRATVSINAAPNAALGDAQLVISTSAGSATLSLSVVDLAYLTPAVESDTRLLWHLDEPDNGPITVTDASPLSINGAASYYSTARPGRFGGGRALTNIFSYNDFGSLYFGSNSFTAECWVKTNPVGMTYTLVGKEDFYGGYYGPPEYAIRLTPNGTLRAMVYDSSQRQWKAELSAFTYAITDNQWHQLAMVVDRANGLLHLYVDGVERASSQMPAGFGAITNSGQPLRVGHYAPYDEQTTGGGAEFPGVIDEVRISASAHSAQRILSDVAGNAGLKITSYTGKELFRSKAGQTSLVNRISVNGYLLDGATARLQRDGQTLAAVATVQSSSYREAQIDVTVDPSVPLGFAQLIISKPGQAEASADVIIEEQGGTPAALDTMLLWNLDEQNNGPERLRDAGPLSINGAASYYSTAVPGHFGGGRGYANAIADNDNGSLYFGSNSFTFGCWVKTGHVGMTYTLVGKEDFFGGYYGPPEFAVRLLPSGGLRAMVYDSSQRQWKAEVAPTTFVIDNNQWHYVAVSVDRTNNQLSLYVDGLERASSQMPAGFGALYNSGQQLRIGHYSPYDEQTTGGGAEFPGVIDDVLISSTAHSTDRVRQDMERDPVLRVLSYDPGEFTRTPLNGQPQSAQMTLNGFGLDGVSAQLLRSGQPLNATVTVVSSAYQQAQLSISVDPSVTPGNAQLVISKPSLPSVSLDVRITEQSEFAIDTDTRLLWHLNETDNGVIQLLDTGPLSINGRAGYYSTAQTGHFGGGRASADAIADADNGSLYFGSNSFTTECWVKTNPVGRTYTLVGKEDFYGGYYGPPEYAIRLTPAGALRALVYDSSQRQWKAEMPGRVYDPAQGRWQVTIDDGQWHHVSMVVDRANSQLHLYVDGVERASSQMPAGFGALYNSGQPLHVGHHSPYDEQTYGGGAEFPGVIDEVRISATAHSAARVFTDSLGTDTSHLATIQPRIIQKGSASVPVTFTGFGLSGATVTTDQPAVTVTVTSSSATTINALVTVPSSVPIGQLHFTITESHGQQLSSQLTIVDQQPFPNPSGGNTGTILLWHLDEPDNGRIPLIGAGDPVPSVLGGATGYYSTAQTGRFGGGRASADAIADADYGSLYFGSNNFTVECWFKTGVLGQTYTIVGKEDFYGGYYGPPEYAIRLSPNGTLRALVYDTSQRQWKAEASGTAVDPNTGQRRLSVNDGLWHHVSMVVDRTNNLLHLYADGVEQASEPMPAGFGALYNSGQPLHVGHYAPYDGQTYGGGAEFPGVIDEVRIVNYAQTAAQMSDTWFGTHTGGNGAVAPNTLNGVANQQANNGAGQPVASQPSVVAPQPSATQSSSAQATLMQLSAVNPREVVRDKASPQPHATLLRIEGEHLDKLAGALLARDGKPLSEANAIVKQSDEHHAEILLSIAPTLKLGPALLVLNRPGTADASIQIQVTEPGEFALEPDTAGLWHLDEHENEATKLLDAGPNMINLTASRASKAVEGRFGGARSLAGATADLISNKLVFDNNGFTVEGWLRTEAVLRDYVIIGKSTNHGDNADFKLKLLRSGALRAEVYDTSGAAWQVEFPAGSSPVTDNRWHSVSMTLDGTARRLALYVDGLERASATAPPAFASIRNLGQPLVLGCPDASDAAATGPEEFPGLLDEVRVSSTAHNAEKIATDYFGHDAPQLTLARPQKINKGAPSISLTLDGYGLGAVQVTTNHPEVLVNVNSSLPTRLELSLIVPEFVGGSALQITVTDPLGQAASIEVAMQGPSSERGRNQRRGAPPNQAGYGALYRPQNSGRQGGSSRMLERQHAARNKD
jgi:hypothetical protein